MEQWKSYNKIPTYEVSNEGRIRNVNTGHIMKTNYNNRGYEQVTLIANRKKNQIKIHKAVAETFNPCNDDKLEVTHKDGDRKNNHADNLIWRTKRDIIKKTYADGRKQTHRMRAIRCIETGEEFESIVECSRVMGIGVNSISRCVNRRSFQTSEGFHFEPIE